MKSKLSILLFTAAMGVSGSATAQLATVSQPTPVNVGSGIEAFNPILSADGDQLLFSAADYSHLQLHNFITGTTVDVDADLRSGFDAQFTPDGKSVVYVAQNTNNQGVNMRQVRSYDIYSGKIAALSEPARVIDRPQLAPDGGFSVMLSGKKMSRKAPAVSVRTWESTLYITVDGVERAYSPVESQAGYLWESLSPDGSKVMFFAAGKGIIVTDLQGNIISRPGNFEHPVWYGNDHIVAMDATDDGHQYHSSRIILLKSDGSLSQSLTNPESMSMNPTASFAAGKVVYNTIDGLLYQINVNINK